jgi:F-type H+-transporting ATPase subunit gamma
MVAKYKKFQKQLLALKKFQEIAKAIRFVAGGELGLLRKEIKCRFLALSSVAPFFNKQFYLQDVNSYLVVPITDDRGSCGSHNNNVIHTAHELITSLEENEKILSLYTIGNKSKIYFKKLYKKYFVGFGSNIRDVKFSIDACYFLMNKLLKFKFDRCMLVFNRYFSIQMQKALAYNLCSFSEFSEILRNRSNSTDNTSIFFKSIKNKSSHTHFLNDFYMFSVSLFLADAMEDNKYSFLAGRFNGMDNAVKSSGDMIEVLNLKYNKARQEYITTELIEIISCKEAIMETASSSYLTEFVITDLYEGFESHLFDLLFLNDFIDNSLVSNLENSVFSDSFVSNDLGINNLFGNDFSSFNYFKYYVLKHGHQDKFRNYLNIISE